MKVETCFVLISKKSVTTAIWNALIWCVNTCNNPSTIHVLKRRCTFEKCSFDVMKTQAKFQRKKFLISGESLAG